MEPIGIKEDLPKDISFFGRILYNKPKPDKLGLQELLCNSGRCADGVGKELELMNRSRRS